MTTTLDLTEYAVLLSTTNGPPDAAQLEAVTVALETIKGAQNIEGEIVQSLGMTAKEAFFAVAISFPTSIAANFATDAIEKAIERSAVAEQVSVKEVCPVEDGDDPAVPIVATRRDDE